MHLGLCRIQQNNKYMAFFLQEFGVHNKGQPELFGLGWDKVSQGHLCLLKAAIVNDFGGTHADGGTPDAF